MRLIVATSLIGAALAACGSKPKEPRVTVEDAVVHLPAVKGRPGAAYFTLRTNNDPTKLVSVASPRIERVDLHDSVTTNGVSRMKKVEGLTFADALEFKPGGRHAMLFGLDAALKPGSTIPLSFTFEPAPPVTVQAKVVGPGGGSHQAH
jgi:copper(I)-binding protein